MGTVDKLPYDRISISEYGNSWFQDDGKWLLVRDMCDDAYASSYAKSNKRVFEANYAEAENTWWCQVGQTIAIRTLAYRNSREIRELLDGLQEYPILDESDCSDLEQEEQEEAWEDWARAEFRTELERALCKRMQESDLPDEVLTSVDDVVDSLSDAQIDHLFWALCEQESEYPEHSGGEVLFPLVDHANAWAGKSRRLKHASQWYRVQVPAGCVPFVDVGGVIDRDHWVSIRHRVNANSSLFAFTTICPHCAMVKRVGVCHTHADCIAHPALGEECPDRLLFIDESWYLPCPNGCEARREARTMVAAE